MVREVRHIFILFYFVPADEATMERSHALCSFVGVGSREIVKEQFDQCLANTR